jgi:methionyl-tRNA synthetase
VVREANKYLAEQETLKLKEDPARQKSILHVALQVVDDAKTLLTPFLPSSSSKVHAMLHGEGRWAAMPDLVEVDEPTAAGSPSYSVLAGDYDTGARWTSTPIEAGRPLAAPTPVFTKLDPSVVDEELARLAPGD